ncbi:hypothetical protein GUITHDRAFT_120053 [Guillardia theta CCMP2712]|uniref:Uncharacterized protein n=1 Tax=Guillardia theta (strain CCMP2712) TaxID=905079 RepID=L1IBW1_GUITC|nr:hypothetical protein GUITHDRAFT_120053 [Guillardia theta CCMP2712]EKX33723.1 hypothetical protein GUITHDRAFT_120053 [Guillardia theta CCMP2712]|eukprot:XP_005820703.1 hypothetical protein GUITHDRAFT_120053 [Guillardia theta CCMP2712]
MGRSRLTDQEKLDIVCLYYSAPTTTSARAHGQEPQRDPREHREVVNPRGTEHPYCPRPPPTTLRGRALARISSSPPKTDQRLNNVCMYYSAPASTSFRRTVHQWDIAKAYGKSRAAISKVLKPEYAIGVMKTKKRAGVMKRIKEEAKRKKRAMQHHLEGKNQGQEHCAELKHQR